VLPLTVDPFAGDDTATIGALPSTTSVGTINPGLFGGALAHAYESVPVNTKNIPGLKVWVVV
jgi:hypothetical protein